MSYIKNIMYIQDCKYINPETQNAQDMLNNCSNENNFVDKILIDYKLKNICNDSINKKLIEGYSNKIDSYDYGPGESYVPKGSCPCGFVQNDKGECVKLFNGCFKTTDKYFNNHHIKKTSENFNINNNTYLNHRHMYTNDCNDIKESEIKDQEIYGINNIFSEFLDKIKDIVK